MDDHGSAQVFLVAGTVFVASLGSLTLAAEQAVPDRAPNPQGNPVGAEALMVAFVKAAGTNWAGTGGNATATSSSSSSSTSTAPPPSATSTSTSPPNTVPGVVQGKCHKQRDDHGWKPLCQAAGNGTAAGANATGNASTQVADNLTLPEPVAQLLNDGNTTNGTWQESTSGFRPGLSRTRGVLDSRKLANLERGAEGGVADDGKVSYAEVRALFGLAPGQGFLLRVLRSDGQLLVEFGQQQPPWAATAGQSARFCLDTCHGPAAERAVRVDLLAWG